MTGTKLLHLIICTSIMNDTILTSGLLGTKERPISELFGLVSCDETDTITGKAQGLAYVTG